MKIVVSGATGLIGTALTSVLTGRGHEIVPLVRRAVRSGERAISWDPDQGRIDRVALEGHDAVIHLAGENVFGRMSRAKMHRIRDSRVLGTRLVSEALGALRRPPATLLAASAVGYYGDRGDETLDERSASGGDFLAQVAREWEAATTAARRAGIRVVNMRFGIVMTPNGGALAKMLPPFRVGLGGPIGSGKQYVSWIALPDLIEAIRYLLDDRSLDGPVNLTSPAPVTNREFARTLGRVLGRPAVVAVPAFALRMAFGVEGAAMMQSGQRVMPRRLEATAFQFAYPAVEPALRHLLAASERGR
jgi:uncharacterized protein